MCGLTGFYIRNNSYEKSFLFKNLISMTNILNHRGPNATGTWIDETNHVGLGHTRLSIRDLSSNGNQPMISSCKKFIIIYNGEIYDTKNIKSELINSGITLKSSSDTEILLEHIAKFGLEKTLKKINGMFAFALFNIDRQLLYLVRDRMGIKPLFYYNNNNSIAFGSEIKSVRQFFNFKSSINLKALNSFLKFGFNKNYTSIFNDLNQVKPGEVLEIDKNLKIRKYFYWSYNNIFKDKKSNDSIEENKKKLEKLITDSINIRLVSDVNVGSFLSGGIDSSLVSKIMSEVSEKKINTYSVGFIEKDYDESKEAKEIAKNIGSNHHEIIIGKNELLEVFEKLPEIYDEPFADSSQIPTTIISHYSKKNAGVILSGDGGDELFGGYTRYMDAEKNQIEKTNSKTVIKKLLANFFLRTNNKTLSILEKILNKKNLQERSKNFLKFENSKKNYNDYLCQWRNLDDLLYSKFIDNNFEDNTDFDYINSPYEKYMAQDVGEYLPNDILTKVDRASMHSSLEVRVPLLDYRIVEFALKLNINQKIYKGNQKIILKKILEDKLPKKLIKNKKIGFGIPLDEWLRSHLNEKVNYLLSDECLKNNPYLNKEFVKKIWRDHQNKTENHGIKLWNIIIFQNWINSKNYS